MLAPITELHIVTVTSYCIWFVFVSWFIFKVIKVVTPLLFLLLSCKNESYDCWNLKLLRWHCQKSHLGSVSPAVPPQSVKPLCWMLTFRVSDLSPSVMSELFPHIPRSCVWYAGVVTDLSSLQRTPELWGCRYLFYRILLCFCFRLTCPGDLWGCQPSWTRRR